MVFPEIPIADKAPTEIYTDEDAEQLSKYQNLWSGFLYDMIIYLLSLILCDS